MASIGIVIKSFMTILVEEQVMVREIEADKVIMKSAYGLMNAVLRLVEKSLDEEKFPTEKFNAENFKVSEIRFGRIVKLLIDDGYLRGISVIENGPTDDFDTEPVPYYEFQFRNPMITIAGMRFLAENSIWSQAWRTVKGIGDLAALVPGV